MKTCLILVKHSLPEIQTDVPASTWHLSVEGKLRTKRLAARLIFYRPDILVSSNEPKAFETAQIIASDLKLELQVVEDLHEHDRTNSPHLPADEFQNAVHEFFLHPDKLVFGNETADEAHARFSKAVQAILEIHKSKTIIIVSHGTVISLFASRLTRVSDISLWNELGLPSFVVLDMSMNSLISKEIIS